MKENPSKSPSRRSLLRLSPLILLKLLLREEEEVDGGGRKRRKKNNVERKVEAEECVFLRKPLFLTLPLGGKSKERQREEEEEEDGTAGELSMDGGTTAAAALS